MFWLKEMIPTAKVIVLDLQKKRSQN
jgi:hypothetical protein